MGKSTPAYHARVSPIRPQDLRSGMVQFIVETKPKIKGMVTVQAHAKLKKELDSKSQISATLLDLLKNYAPEHDFVAGIMCDGAIVSLHLISLPGSLGFNDPKATKIGIPKTDPTGSKNERTDAD